MLKCCCYSSPLWSYPLHFSIIFRCHLFSIFFKALHLPLQFVTPFLSVQRATVFSCHSSASYLGKPPRQDTETVIVVPFDIHLSCVYNPSDVICCCCTNIHFRFVIWQYLPRVKGEKVRRRKILWKLCVVIAMHCKFPHTRMAFFSLSDFNKIFHFPATPQPSTHFSLTHSLCRSNRLRNQV